MTARPWSQSTDENFRRTMAAIEAARARLPVRAPWQAPADADCRLSDEAVAALGLRRRAAAEDEAR